LMELPWYYLMSAACSLQFAGCCLFSAFCCKLSVGCSLLATGCTKLIDHTSLAVPQLQQSGPLCLGVLRSRPLQRAQWQRSHNANY
jgi:hypothetical protein